MAGGPYRTVSMMSASSESTTKCIKCSKIVFEGQNSIQCDDCDGWIHLKCSGMKLKEFNKLCQEENSSFRCRFCQEAKTAFKSP